MEKPFPYPSEDLQIEALNNVLGARRMPLNVYKMLHYSRGLSLAFMQTSDAIRHQCSISADERELAVLRTGWHFNAVYEITHHKRVAREAGLSEEAIEASQSEARSSGLPERHQAMIEITDALIEDEVLSGDALATANKFFSPEQILDLIIVVGFYRLVCVYLKTFKIEVES